MDTHFALELANFFVEVAILIVLLAEYFYGRSDMDIKNEAKRKKKAREKYNFESLTSGEGK